MPAVAVDGTEAVPVVSGGGRRREVHITNTGPNPVYLGTEPDVTHDTGLPLQADERLRLVIGEHWTIYARCETGETADVRWLAA